MRLAILIATAITMFLCCDKLSYMPKGADYVDVPESTTPVTISLSGNIDTLRVWGDYLLNYYIDGGRVKPCSVICYINSQRVFAGDSSSRVVLHVSSIPDGIYTFRIVVYTYSKANSLGSNARLEFVQTEKSLPVEVCNGVPIDSIRINAIEVSNGRLKVSWEKYPKYNFYKYLIFSNKKLIDSITDRNTNFWFDQYYLGDSVTYKVEAIVANTLLDGVDTSYYSPMPVITGLVPTNFDSLKVSWTKCPFDSNFLSYTVSRSTSLTNFIAIDTIWNVHDTCFVDTAFAFGQRIYYKIVTKPIYPPWEYHKYYWDSPVASIATGDSFPVYSTNITYVPSINSFYVKTKGAVVRLDGTTHRVIASLTNNANYFSIASDGSFAISGTQYQSIMNFMQTINQVDPLTMQIIDSVRVDTIFHRPYTYANDMTATRNKKVLFRKIDSKSTGGWLGDAIYAYDYANATITGEFIGLLTYLERFSAVSENGINVICPRGKIVDLRDNSIQPIPNILCASFFANDEYFVATDNKTIAIYRTSDLSMIRQYPQQVLMYSPTIDPVTGFLSVNTDDHRLLIFDINTGVLKAAIRTLPYVSVWYLNSLLISNAGCCLPFPLH